MNLVAIQPVAGLELTDRLDRLVLEPLAAFEIRLFAG